MAPARRGGPDQAASASTVRAGRLHRRRFESSYRPHPSSPESAPKGPRPLPGRRRVRAPRGWPYPEKAVSQTSQADEVEVARLNPLTEAICRALYGEQAVHYVELA